MQLLFTFSTSEWQIQYCLWIKAHLDWDPPIPVPVIMVKCFLVRLHFFQLLLVRWFFAGKNHFDTLSGRICIPILLTPISWFSSEYKYFWKFLVCVFLLQKVNLQNALCMILRLNSIVNVNDILKIIFSQIVQFAMSIKSMLVQCR